MLTRSRETTVTFKNAFTLAEIGSAQPPGDYLVVTDEEEILGISFVAYRRTSTLLHLPALSSTGRSSQVVAVDPTSLERVLKLDRADGGSAPDGGRP